MGRIIIRPFLYPNMMFCQTILAKQRDITKSIKPILEEIKATNFRISADLELKALLLSQE
jgi:predicted nucleic acid-binding protein